MTCYTLEYKNCIFPGRCGTMVNEISNVVYYKIICCSAGVWNKEWRREGVS